MRRTRRTRAGSVAGLIVAVILGVALHDGAGRATQAADLTLTLNYGVLAGLTGDSAASGQLWNESTRIAILHLNRTLSEMGLGDSIKAVLADSQDSQGKPADGIEAARKLVDIAKVQVVMGDIFSSVTAAVATSVTVPARVIQFTGGTNASLTQLNPAGGPTFLWQPPGADDLQGQVLAQVIGEGLGPKAKISIGARNDTYGAGLAEQFRQAWTAKGGEVLKSVIYNHQQPTLDTEAQQLVQGNPDGWLLIDFCPTFAKLLGPLQRTGQWDPARSFGSDALRNCTAAGYKNVPGMRATGANVSSGTSLPAYEKLYRANAKSGLDYQAWTAEAFDSVLIAFLAALAARSPEPTKLSPHIAALTNPPGRILTFEQLDQAIKATLAGEKIQYSGVSGPLNFTARGRAGTAAFDIYQVQPDTTSRAVKTIFFNAPR
jgi:ABC-type branched-subunit amino acid transport system substrate-binding protein